MEPSKSDLGFLKADSKEEKLILLPNGQLSFFPRENWR
jgi:beta-galactosidase beta subunit